MSQDDFLGPASRLEIFSRRKILRKKNKIENKQIDQKLPYIKCWVIFLVVSIATALIAGIVAGALLGLGLGAAGVAKETISGSRTLSYIA